MHIIANQWSAMGHLCQCHGLLGIRDNPLQVIVGLGQLLIHLLACHTSITCSFWGLCDARSMLLWEQDKYINHQCCVGEEAFQWEAIKMNNTSDTVVGEWGGIRRLKGCQEGRMLRWMSRWEMLGPSLSTLYLAPRLSCIDYCSCFQSSLSHKKVLFMVCILCAISTCILCECNLVISALSSQTHICIDSCVSWVVGLLVLPSSWVCSIQPLSFFCKSSMGF